MEILKIPNPILTTKANEIIDFSNILNLKDEMIEIIKENSLLGLAGTQINFPFQIFVINMGENLFKIFINAKIKFEKNNKKEWGWESCASLPNVSCLIERPKNIDVTALDENGNNFSVHLENLFARICMHEYDHGLGILITKKAREIKRL